jgi:hypothetical protein
MCGAANARERAAPQPVARLSAADNRDDRFIFRAGWIADEQAVLDQAGQTSYGMRG